MPQRNTHSPENMTISSKGVYMSMLSAVNPSLHLRTNITPDVAGRHSPDQSQRTPLRKAQTLPTEWFEQKSAAAARILILGMYSMMGHVSPAGCATASIPQPCGLSPVKSWKNRDMENTCICSTDEEIEKCLRRAVSLFPGEKPVGHCDGFMDGRAGRDHRSHLPRCLPSGKLKHALRLNHTERRKTASVKTRIEVKE